MTGSGDRNKPKQAIAITEIRMLIEEVHPL